MSGRGHADLRSRDSVGKYLARSYPWIVACAILLVGGALAEASIFAGPRAGFQTGIVANPTFGHGGASYADRWRPLPGGVRMYRWQNDEGDYSLFLGLREDGDGGVIQVVDLPPRRHLSLRMLATCWSADECYVVASLVRISDGEVLSEVVVDGVERGVMAENLWTGKGGNAELTIRLVGRRGGSALIDWIGFGKPAEPYEARTPDFSGEDILLAPGAGLRVDADFEPRLLPEAARMLQEAIEDVTGQATRSIGARVTVSVTQPETTDWPARESYRLAVDAEQGVRIEAPAEQGAFWGMMSLIDLMRREPDGGLRILAVDVEDDPALRWRIVHDRDLDTRERFSHGVRRIARLKLNMALFDNDLPGTGMDDADLMELLRGTAVEPLVVIEAATAEQREAALTEFRDRFGVKRFLIHQWRDCGERIDWEEPALALAREAAPELKTMVSAFDESRGEAGKRTLEPLPVTEMERWPREIVALMLPHTHSEAAARLLIAAEMRGIRFVLMEADGLQGARTAVRACQRSENCLGVFITGDRDLQEQSADLAWRGLPPVPGGGLSRSNR